MNRNDVMELFNKRPRIGTLSTANRKGEVNVAVFGSPQMIDENTVVMGIGENRTLANLQENPHAVFIVMEPGKTLMDWKGVRVYLEVLAVETGGGKNHNGIRDQHENIRCNNTFYNNILSDLFEYKSFRYRCGVECCFEDQK